MRPLVAVSVALAGFLSCMIVATAGAEGSPATPDKEARAADNDRQSGLGSDPDDPQNLLPEIRKRGAERDSLFPVSPLHRLHESTDRAKQALYDAVGLDAGVAFTHLFQGLSEARPDEDQWGTVSNIDILGSLELLARGTPTQGELTVHAQGRWNYGTTNPDDLGFVSL